MMKTKTMWLAVVIAAALVLMAGGAGVLAGPTAPEATVAGKINYQGRLTDPGGAPLSGTYPMRFQIYNDPGAGALLWDSGVMNVDVDHGLFNVALAVDPAAFNGQGLWLRLYVNGEWLVPRQELLPVPYALSLRPGAQIQGDATTWVDGWVLDVHMNGAYPLASAIRSTTATGAAVYGNSSGYGLSGYSDLGNAIVGRSNQKTAGVFSSNGGYGIQATANGSTVNDHAGVFSANWGWGVYATSAHNHAIRGEAGDVTGLSRPGGTWGAVGIGEVGGVYGSGGSLAGVYGYDTTRPGVYGETASDDATVAAGVWGYKGSGGGDAVRGLKYGNWGRAIYGTNWGDTGSGVVGESTNYVGVWAESGSDYGVQAQTGAASNNYGVYTPDNLWSLNIHLAGAIMHLAQNGGSEALEPGDVAVFSGVAAPLEAGGPPVVQVARTASANSTAVAGVVYSRFNIKVVTAKRQSDGQGSEAGQEVTLDGPVPPGEYLLLVVQGPAQVKASALSGAIRPGDLLSSAGQAGYAAKAAEITIEGVKTTVPGAVFGKALEPLDGSQELIYVFVTLQ
jgi:hypothetical protein